MTFNYSFFIDFHINPLALLNCQNSYLYDDARWQHVRSCRFDMTCNLWNPFPWPLHLDNTNHGISPVYFLPDAGFNLMASRCQSDRNLSPALTSTGSGISGPLDVVLIGNGAGRKRSGNTSNHDDRILLQHFTD